MSYLSKRIEILERKANQRKQNEPRQLKYYRDQLRLAQQALRQATIDAEREAEAVAMAESLRRALLDIVDQIHATVPSVGLVTRSRRSWLPYAVALKNLPDVLLAHGGVINAARKWKW